MDLPCCVDKQDGTFMKAFTKSSYGGPEVLHLSIVDKPYPAAQEVLVRVMANSANPADWHILRGEPWIARLSFGIFKPKNPILGADFAGIVEEVGHGINTFQPGDRVFGESLKGGAFAEYTVVPVQACAHMPDNMEFDQMAGVPIAGLTALQALITHGKLEAGQTVLVNGASGGVGHFAVQIAKAYGAKVTGVCSGRNTEFVRSLGADHVIAYDQQNIHQHEGTYDLVLDAHGNLNFSDFKRMGQLGVMIGFTTMGHMIKVMISSRLSKYPLLQFTAKANTEDLETLATLIASGQIKTHIDRQFSFEQIPEAISYIEKMRTKGKVVMNWT